MALDGYRLAIVERPVTAVKDIRIIVPSKTMNEVAHLLANDDEELVHISANRRYVVFTTAGYTIMSRLIEGEFLNYHNVIPSGSRTTSDFRHKRVHRDHRARFSDHYRAFKKSPPHHFYRG